MQPIPRNGDPRVVLVPAPRTRPGLVIPRWFTKAGVNPFETAEWEVRTASIIGDGGRVVFEQRDVEVPKGWSQTATNVVAQKYFRGQLGTPGRERSVRQLIRRVANTIAAWGDEAGYFRSDDDYVAFNEELVHLLLHQKMAFNSPVWFNVGVEERPQCSACFLNSVEDSMESILELAKTEGMLFKWGSGTGSNLSALRSSKEHLSGGGTASGPVSFMRGFDAFAGAIKSGGKTRRAAKMVILNIDHPDIVDFIECKAREERKAWALVEAGYDGGFNVPGGAYDSIAYQNANHSVRVTDDFMEAVLRDGESNTRAVTDGRIMDTLRARELLRRMAAAAHQCGDPGIQFDTTTNAYNTCAATGRINTSNPCSEFVFLDDTACNLASLNLRRFQRPDGELDTESFKRAIEVTIVAQEILVDRARYPTSKIAENSHRFRPLGLGYANLGALLMSRGLAYDSDEGRAHAAAVTALLGGHAYTVSARLARDAKGAFEGFASNREPFLTVMRKQRRNVEGIEARLAPAELVAAARVAWDEAIAVGEQHGFRNAQTTLLAPTGTIAFMMDCDTTGIEPDLALVKYKRLVGGGTLKMVNQTVPEALARLGYKDETVRAIQRHIDEHGTIEGAADLQPEHLPVFDCALRAARGARAIAPMGHVRMMAACQSFLSGAISKTVNLPGDCTVEDIETIFVEAWKLGLKAIAVYRDGCKRTQPLSTSTEKVAIATTSGPPPAVRHRLLDERRSITHKFSVGGHEGYCIVGLYEDGAPGELFVQMAKEGSTVAGLMDAFATAVSIGLQHGVPLRVLCEKFRSMRFEPGGFTGNRTIPRASSLMDYLARWLERRFLDQGESPSVLAPEATAPMTSPRLETDAPPCHDCGAIMVRAGSCHRCGNCGSTSGCS